MIKIFFCLFLSVFFLVHAKIQEKVVICGICKDVGNGLHSSKKIMENIGDLFQDYRIVIYENNSTDSTKKNLQRWARSNSKVYVKMENLSQEEIRSMTINQESTGQIFRIELIARARNIVLDKAMSDEYKEFTYVLWMDMDFRVPPSFEGIEEVFNSNREWDAVFAYGISSENSYWDWYAFRDFIHYPLGRELVGDAVWHGPRVFKLSQSDPWCPVMSAFGGFGIYKKSSIVGCRYSAIVTKDQETVSKKIISEGVKTGHTQVLSYLENLEKLRDIVKIDQPTSNLQKIYDENVGIVLDDSLDRLIWRLNCFTYQYPSVCEHVPFHASMIVNGHDKLFINPRMLFFLWRSSSLINSVRLNVTHTK